MAFGCQYCRPSGKRLVLERTRTGSGSSSTFVKFEFEKFDFFSKKQSSKSSTFDFAKFDKFGFEFFRVRSNTTNG